MSLSQDLLEELELDWVGVLHQAALEGVKGSHVHVTVAVEVVHKFKLFDVLEDEVAHGLCLGLREREWSRESLRARVLFRALVAM